MRIHKSITVDRVIEAVSQDDNLGFCLACGDDAYGVEPDAEGYTCESCGKPSVMGAEQVLLFLA